VREERAVLEDHADAPVLGLDPGAVACHRPPGDRHAARVRLLEAGDHAQERRLARPAGAEQRDELALRHFERRAVHRAGAAEALVDAAGIDRRFRHHRVRLP
jgi:hypothetical protein